MLLVCCMRRSTVSLEYSHRDRKTLFNNFKENTWWAMSWTTNEWLTPWWFSIVFTLKFKESYSALSDNHLSGPLENIVKSDVWCLYPCARKTFLYWPPLYEFPSVSLLLNKLLNYIHKYIIIFTMIHTHAMIYHWITIFRKIPALKCFFYYSIVFVNVNIGLRYG